MRCTNTHEVDKRLVPGSPIPIKVDEHHDKDNDDAKKGFDEALIRPIRSNRPTKSFLFDPLN